jgi:hypothetical protein
MTGLLTLDQLVSAWFAGVCWVLAHQIASKPGAVNRIIGVAYSVAGFAALASIVFRFEPEFRAAAPWAGAVAMIGVTVALSVMSVRIALGADQAGRGGG